MQCAAGYDCAFSLPRRDRLLLLPDRWSLLLRHDSPVVLELLQLPCDLGVERLALPILYQLMAATTGANDTSPPLRLTRCSAPQYAQAKRSMSLAI